MKFFLPGTIVLAVLLLVNTAGHAADNKLSLDVFPRAGLGLNRLNYKRPDNTRLKASYATLNIGLTARFHMVYVDVGGELFGLDFLTDSETGEITGIERQDYTGTLGITPYKGSSVFVGYTVGEMKDDFREQFHDDRGYFFGAGYSHNIGNTAVGLTIAYADLDGNVTEDGDPTANTKGQTSGYSYGLSASGPFRQTMAYSISLKVREYEYEDTAKLTTDKKITSLNFNLIF
jgi:hypothetical protein